MFSLPTYILYCITSTITPGPNNLMSMSWGMRVGFFKALPFNLGVITGFFAVMLLCCIGCAALNSLIPEIMGPMKILGTLYLVWLAWKILKAVYSLKPFEIDKKKAFISGFCLQFVNVKIMVYGIVSMQTFILPHFTDPWILVGFSFFLAAMGSGCNLIWSAFGSAFAHLFSKYTRPVNAVLALSLLFCAGSLWI